jgi:hypothetical protein
MRLGVVVIRDLDEDPRQDGHDADYGSQRRERGPPRLGHDRGYRKEREGEGQSDSGQQTHPGRVDQPSLPLDLSLHRFSFHGFSFHGLSIACCSGRHNGVRPLTGSG